MPPLTQATILVCVLLVTCMFGAACSTCHMHVTCPTPELLSSLVEYDHQAAMDSLPKLKETFSSLSFLPPDPALDLLHAVLVSL